MSRQRTPRDWVDEVAIERVLRRQYVGRPLSHAERVIATQHIAAHGGGTSAISTRLRVNPAYAAELLVEATADTRKAAAVNLLAPEIQAVLPAAQNIVAAVHAMDPAAVADVLAATDLPALCIVLAGMLPADVDAVDAISWATNPDEYLRLRNQGVKPQTAAVLATAHGGAAA
jgi:hypothetical protein